MLITRHLTNFRYVHVEIKDVVNLAFHEFFERRQYLPEQKLRRDDPIARTLKLEPELYFQLKRRGMGTKPRKSNQALIVEAIKAFLGQGEAHG
jgi:hypothetical protein